MKTDKPYIFAVLGILLLIILAFIYQDYRDRNFICKDLNVKRHDISRTFFHLEGKGNRVYTINGRTYIVTGLIWLAVYHE